MANSTVMNEDERLLEVEANKDAALQEVEQTYGGMVSEAGKYYQDQMDATDQWAEEQTKLQNEQTEFTIQQIEQQKEQTQKDYTKEQSAAYADYQKQTAQHGVNAEAMAAQGMKNTGFSESSRVSIYNTYQNRVATAKASVEQAMVSYNNSITQARLQNNSALAEIAATALQKKLELALQGFQYENQLVTEMLGMKMQTESLYHGQYMDILGQINTEKAFEESVRQYDQDFAYQQEQDAQAQSNWEKEFTHVQEQDKLAQENWQKTFDEEVRQNDRNYNLQVKSLEEEIRQYNQNHELKVKEYEEGIRQFNAEIARLKENDAQAYALEIQQLEQQKALAEAELEEEQRQFDADMAEMQRQYDLSLQEEQRQFDAAASGSVAIYEVSTPYYQGPKNADCEKYGTFSNGYQPKGITGHGKLSDSGDTISLATKYVYGEKAGTKLTVEQKVWKAEDGTLWYWEGRDNKYIQIPTTNETTGGRANGKDSIGSGGNGKLKFEAGW